MKKTYITILTSITLISVLMVKFLPFHGHELPDFRDSGAQYAPLLPKNLPIPGEAAAQPVPLFSQNVVNSAWFEARETGKETGLEVPNNVYVPEDVADSAHVFAATCFTGEHLAEENSARDELCPCIFYTPQFLADAVPCGVSAQSDKPEQPIGQPFAGAAVVSGNGPTPEVQEQSADPTPSASYVYFYTGIPVMPAPQAVFVYPGGAVRTAPMSLSPASTASSSVSQPPFFVPSAPSQTMATQTMSARTVPVSMVRANVVPVFVPQVAPSRFGAPRLVYPNGVVIKPQVYYPGQPVRNTIRGFTP